MGAGQLVAESYYSSRISKGELTPSGRTMNSPEHHRIHEFGRFRLDASHRRPFAAAQPAQIAEIPTVQGRMNFRDPQELISNETRRMLTTEEDVMKPTVREMMDRATHAVSADLPIRDAINVLIDKGVTGIPVLDASGHVLGVLSEEHCLKLIAEGDESFDEPKGTVGAYFDSSAPQVPPDFDIYYVAGMFMREQKHRRFPVVENGKLVGVITRKDVLRALRDLLPK